MAKTRAIVGHRGEVLVGALSVGAVSSRIKGIKSGTVSIDPGSIATVTRGTGAGTITGLAAGDIVVMSPPAALNDDLVFAGARVTGADTVTVYLYNPTAGAIDDTARTWDYLWFDLT